jgi:hypothetical protein
MDLCTHQILRQLIHFIDDGPGQGFPSGTTKQVYGKPFPSGVIWYTDATRTEKLLEKVIYPPLNRPTAITWNLYATGGTLVAQMMTDHIVYTGAFEAWRIRSLDPC